jgi:hypothetical protein
MVEKIVARIDGEGTRLESERKRLFARRVEGDC